VKGGLAGALGVDLNGVLMTMLSLIALYLIVTNAPGVNAFIRNLVRGGAEIFTVLQGREPRRVLGPAPAPTRWG
jgi:hypothetical protein